MVTMKDVARRAGVGVGTVSRVINHAPGVKESTLNKVNQAIKELKYIPDEYARGLKTNNSKTIVLILPTVWYPFFSEFAYYVEQSLDKKGYKLILCDSNGNPEEEAKYIKMIRQNKIDAIIAITYSDIEEYMYLNIPFVCLDRYFDEKVSYVTSDNYQGGRIAAKELLKHGAKNLAYVGSYNKYSNGTMLRRNGFRDYLNDKDIDFQEIFLLEPVEDFAPYLLDMLKQHPNIDGIFCHNDALLLKIQKILTEHNYNIPSDIQLIGFDGMNLAADLPLGVSTVAQPVEALANGAVDLVLRKIMYPNAENKVKIYPVKYIDGNTTK